MDDSLALKRPMEDLSLTGTQQLLRHEVDNVTGEVEGKEQWYPPFYSRKELQMTIGGKTLRLVLLR